MKGKPEIAGTISYAGKKHNQILANLFFLASATK
jgi:hypothetical protein